MPLPQPPVALTGACSVIYNNTLYSYSTLAFQSLALEEGAEWKKLSDGQSVEGGVCVGSTPKDASQAGFYVVGGTTNDTTYKGLQKFTYSTGKWESISPQGPVTESRVYHSAAYINASDTILVYAGSQMGVKYLSSQTFTIGASAPYSVLAYPSVAPPAIAPILLPWSETAAVMIGGDPSNTKIMLFEPGKAWFDSNSTLADPIVKNSTQVKGVILTGDDGSKHLYTFDPSTTPTTVNRTVLINGSGAPVVKSAPIINRRDLNAGDWPTYNSTLAPVSLRTDYSIATNANGLVVMSGGNTNDILCMFNGRQNGWENATAALVGAEVKVSSVPTSSSSSTPTSSASQVATSAATAFVPSSGLPPTTILGIALGVIFGLAFLLVALLFLMKRKRQQKAFVEAGHIRRASGLPDEKYDLPRDIAEATGGYYPRHGHKDSEASFSSMAILMGKGQKQTLNRKGSKDSRESSVSSILNKQFKSTIGRPSPIPQPEIGATEERATAFTAAGASAPRPRAGPSAAREGDTRRSSGWNRYWSGGGNSQNAINFSAGPRRETRTSRVSEQSSQYSADKYRLTQDSATVPPLHMEGRPEFNRVHSGSPTVSYYNASYLKEGQAGQIERPVSATSSSGYSSGIPPSVQETWDSTTGSANKTWGEDRAPTHAYSQSTYPTALGAPRSNRPTNDTTREHHLAMASTASDMSWLNLGDNSTSNRQYR